MEKKFLCYEDFGAKGDGVADDLYAIVACHEEANKTGTPVKARDGARYYIGTKKMTAYIKTDVDFGTAEFIIDDRGLEDIRFDVFEVISEFPRFTPDIKSVKKGQTKIDIAHEGNIYVHIYNDNDKIFIREGKNMNSGTATSDCFLVDENGNIFPTVDWDYPEITSCRAQRIDDKPITIRGGIFTTIANDAASFYNYHWHGICIKRANVTVEGLRHYVTGEGEHGAPYRGFIALEETANVTLKDCIITGHKIYYTESKIPGVQVAMGSYDVNVYATINASLIGVKQSNSINDVTKWGIFTSNFAKNLLFDGCEMSRFDAHMGVTNVTVRNCVLGHEGLLLIGYGEAIIENTEARCYDLFNLRGDYGALWDGNITIKNCYWNYTPLAYWTDNCKNTCIFSAFNNGYHDFGFTCYMPHTITIDGLRINDTLFDEPAYLLPVYEHESGEERPFPYQPTERIIARGVTTVSGRPVELCKNKELYKDIVADIG